MKIILILSFVLFIKDAHSQIPGSYITNNTMTAFHGTWQWNNGVDTMKIYFNTAKVFVNINGGFYWDNLVGWYIYKKNNVVVFSNYNRIGNTTLRSTIQGGNEYEPSNQVPSMLPKIKLPGSRKLHPV